ncbi:hypothetical protein AM501_26775 [Aneurinibacillus migulanus]|uniref:hypothetical protein n=1 Tax=Aneurinibacillus migulanus TaxID=47500 RepID=UPI0005B9DEF9|nr:hypothetical protein [Aneurinibacillus migulanus]KIV55037.1 hypothetical protein TS64_12210 [Aneurinibacillus migulanus]KPD05321.1 hypothetical protein AM501_26775 [Aneurinibacillus migulanus]
MFDQLHLRISSSELDFSKVVNDFNELDYLSDRYGGFWTSTYNPQFGCEWLHSRKVHKPFADSYNGYIFKVDKDTKIFNISTSHDEQVFENEFDNDCNKLSKLYDAIHVAGDYIRYLRKNRYNTRFLFWTCECTWWFNVDKLTLIKKLEGNEIKELANKDINIL